MSDAIPIAAPSPFQIRGVLDGKKKDGKKLSSKKKAFIVTQSNPTIFAQWR